MTPTAQLFFVLSLAACLAYGGLGVRALSWNPRGQGNQALALLCAGCCTWALSMALMLTSPDRQGALFWYQIAATGYLVAPAAALHSYLRLTHEEWIEKRTWLEAAVYLPAPIFILKNWFGMLGNVDVLLTRNGWVESIGGFDGWYVAYMAYLVTYGLATVATSALRWRHAENRTERLQSIWLTLGGIALIPLIVGFGLLLPVLSPGLPEISHLLVLVWVMAAWKAMQIRNPWTLTPQLVADQLLEALSEAVLITDPEGRVQIANPAAEKLFDTTSKQLAGSHVNLLLPLRGSGIVCDGRIRADVQNLEVEVRDVQVDTTDTSESQDSIATDGESSERPRGDSDSHWYSISSSGVLNELEELVGVLITLREITAMKAAERDLEFRATHDPLTELANRRLLQTHLEAVCARERDEAFALLMIDLDDFKQVNDRHGHAIGDQLLSILGRRIRGCLRRTDTAARFGGDEFVVLLPEVRQQERATQVAQRILEACRRPFEIEGQLLAVDASIGIAISGPSVRSAEDVLRDADRAMYRAKRAESDRIEIALVGSVAADGASSTRLEN